MTACTHTPTTNPNAKRVLFIGNSYTFFQIKREEGTRTPNSFPYLVQDIVRENGEDLEVRVLTHGGYSLQDHLQYSDIDSALAERWDYVVFQERSRELLENPDGATHSIETLVKKVREHGATPLLFENWAKKDEPENIPQLSFMLGALEKKFHIRGIPIGTAWRKALEHGIPLHTKDTTHANVFGVYVAAWTLGAIFSPKDATNCDGRTTDRLNGMKEDQLRLGETLEDAWWTQKTFKSLCEIGWSTGKDTRMGG